MNPIFITLFIWYSWLHEACRKKYEQFCHFYTYLCHYRKEDQYLWYIDTPRRFPLCKLHMESCEDLDPFFSSTWTYHSYTNHLSDRSTENLPQSRISWLSALIRVRTKSTVKEYEMDTFLQSFHVESIEKILTVSDLFLCWCIYEKRWFASASTVEVEWIDEEGEFHSAPAESPMMVKRTLIAKKME